MKYKGSKRNDLLSAIISGDKSKLIQVLQDGKPVKWVCVVLDYKEGTISIGDRISTEGELWDLLKSLKKEFNVRLMVMEFNDHVGSGCPVKWNYLQEPDLLLHFKHAGVIFGEES